MKYVGVLSLENTGIFIRDFSQMRRLLKMTKISILPRLQENYTKCDLIFEADITIPGSVIALEEFFAGRTGSVWLASEFKKVGTKVELSSFDISDQ